MKAIYLIALQFAFISSHLAFACGGEEDSDVKLKFEVSGDDVIIKKTTISKSGKSQSSTLKDDDGYATLYALSNWAPPTASSDSSVKSTVSTLARKLNAEYLKIANDSDANLDKYKNTTGFKQQVYDIGASKARRLRGIAEEAAKIADLNESEGFSQNVRKKINMLRGKMDYDDDFSGKTDQSDLSPKYMSDEQSEAMKADHFIPQYYPPEVSLRGCRDNASIEGGMPKFQQKKAAMPGLNGLQIGTATRQVQ